MYESNGFFNMIRSSDRSMVSLTKFRIRLYLSTWYPSIRITKFSTKFSIRITKFSTARLKLARRLSIRSTCWHACEAAVRTEVQGQPVHLLAVPGRRPAIRQLVANSPTCPGGVCALNNTAGARRAAGDSTRALTVTGVMTAACTVRLPGSPVHCSLYCVAALRCLTFALFPPPGA